MWSPVRNVEKTVVFTHIRAETFFIIRGPKFERHMTVLGFTDDSKEKISDAQNTRKTGAQDAKGSKLAGHPVCSHGSATSNEQHHTPSSKANSSTSSR